MRLSIVSVLVLLAACSPPAPPASEPTPAERILLGPADQNADALAATPASGEWVYHGGETYDAACLGTFRAPESQCQFTVQCELGTHYITLIAAHAAGDEATTLTLRTNRATIALPAQALNEPPPRVRAVITDLARRSETKLALMRRQERFAIEIAGETTVYPWNDEIYELLLACD